MSKKQVKKTVPRKNKKTLHRKKKPAVKIKRINLLDPLLLGIFFLFLAIFLKTQLSNPLPLSAEQVLKRYDKQVDFSKLPTEIAIPKLNLALPVTHSLIVNGKWGVSPDGASHLLTSAMPGQSGNIIIYGHNKPGEFKDLVKIGIGDIMKVKNAKGINFLYRVVGKNVVWPNQISFLYPTQTETLTVYTCTGLFDSQRLVIQAKPLTIKSLSNSEL